MAAEAAWIAFDKPIEIDAVAWLPIADMSAP
jgi:hypothetical protein